ncbi:hypothetical protein BU25DRAFT_463014 [Macroventuria anomochaeta]|uniref:Uncharacterized protein n=1 Tax=Macroventuria anomochaeta TaxID=301207 RepID=A0ACB6RK27_9PLEO|nr:uncharacterized protein BU25DRAFT_463014 [Macroventuria anomochaeta]KAF2622256.1 hypothetical protein BU25DRAFT_463014 [Macroventuria anomochaeta]
MKVRKAEHFNPYAKPNVSIEVNNTPDMQRIHKIESLYKHRMQPEGLDEHLLVTVILEPNTEDKFKEMDQYDSETKAFKFFWDVHANRPDSKSCFKLPSEVITHGTCLNFFTKKPCRKAMFVPRPDHPDNPRRVLFKDSDFKPDKTLKFTGTKGGCCV